MEGHNDRINQKIGINRQNINGIGQGIDRIGQVIDRIVQVNDRIVQANDIIGQGIDRIDQGMNRIQQLIEQLMGGNDLPVNGLTPERVENFEHFAAPESLVGEQCIVCLKDLDVGMQMVRLDCHVSHYLCKTCTDEWFKDHKTCPTCNHIFN